MHTDHLLSKKRGEFHSLLNLATNQQSNRNANLYGHVNAVEMGFGLNLGKRFRFQTSEWRLQQPQFGSPISGLRLIKR